MPTEAECEQACRAGTPTPFALTPGNASLPSLAIAALSACTWDAHGLRCLKAALGWMGLSV